MKILLFVLAAIFVIAIVYKGAHMPPTETATLHVTNMPLDQLLDSVSKKIEFSWFVEDDSVKKLFRPVTVNLDSAGLNDVVRILQEKEPLVLFNFRTTSGPMRPFIEIVAKPKL